MSFKDLPAHQTGVALLQRSLERGRLAHAYLFTGQQMEELETLARLLAKTLNCLNPVKAGQAAIDCCEHCLSCKKIEHGNHADVHWVRPESKSRIIKVGQIRDVMKEIQMKPTEAEYKVAVIVGADRLWAEAANAFLKTLEEPPAKSILVLLTTDPRRILETILSRCLRVNFGGSGPRTLGAAELAWLNAFGELAAAEQKSLLGRYRLMDVLMRKLAETKEAVEKSLSARSPLERYPEAEKALQDRWEDELAAAIEGEYRRQRADLLGLLHWWLRDVWIHTLGASGSQTLLNYPQLAESGKVARRISARDALANLEVLEQLQGWLSTNVQEALALEVGLLKLRL
jgi:DNA polymerase-3 subunit delta'